MPQEFSRMESQVIQQYQLRRVLPTYPSKPSAMIHTQQERLCFQKKFKGHESYNTAQKGCIPIVELVRLTQQTMKYIDSIYVKQPSYITPTDWRWTGSRADLGLLDGVKDKRGFQPVSRGFFKMQEMLNYIQKKPQDVLCLCQGSGGFVQAILQQYPDAYIDAGTLTTVQPNLQHPGFRQIVKGRHVSVINLGNGNVFQKSFIRAAKTATYDLITMDAAQMTKSYAQRQDRHNAFLQVLLTQYVPTLKRGGSLVFKIFGVSNHFTLCYLETFSSQFKKIRVLKPTFSNPLSAQLYVIATGYKQGQSLMPTGQLIRHIHNLSYKWTNRKMANIITPQSIRHLKSICNIKRLYQNYVKRLTCNDTRKRQMIQIILGPEYLSKANAFIRRQDYDRVKQQQRVRSQERINRQKTQVFIPNQIISKMDGLRNGQIIKPNQNRNYQSKNVHANGKSDKENRKTKKKYVAKKNSPKKVSANKRVQNRHSRDERSIGKSGRSNHHVGKSQIPVMKRLSSTPKSKEWSKKVQEKEKSPGKNISLIRSDSNRSTGPGSRQWRRNVTQKQLQQIMSRRNVSKIQKSQDIKAESLNNDDMLINRSDDQSQKSLKEKEKYEVYDQYDDYDDNGSRSSEDW